MKTWSTSDKCAGVVVILFAVVLIAGLWSCSDTRQGSSVSAGGSASQPKASVSFESGHYYRLAAGAPIPVMDTPQIYQAKREFAEHLVGAPQGGDEFQVLRWHNVGWLYIAVTKANGHVCDVRGYALEELLRERSTDIGAD